MVGHWWMPPEVRRSQCLSVICSWLMARKGTVSQWRWWPYLWTLQLWGWRFAFLEPSALWKRYFTKSFLFLRERDLECRDLDLDENTNLWRRFSAMTDQQSITPQTRVGSGKCVWIKVRHNTEKERHTRFFTWKPISEKITGRKDFTKTLWLQGVQWICWYVSELGFFRVTPLFLVGGKRFIYSPLGYWTWCLWSQRYAHFVCGNDRDYWRWTIGIACRKSRHCP